MIATSPNMRTLAKTTSAGAVMANRATRSRAQAVERRWSATDAVTPLRDNNVGNAAVPIVKHMNSVKNPASEIVPNV